MGYPRPGNTSTADPSRRNAQARAEESEPRWMKRLVRVGTIVAVVAHDRSGTGDRTARAAG
jgi:hypothetical protein